MEVAASELHRFVRAGHVRVRAAVVSEGEVPIDFLVALDPEVRVDAPRAGARVGPGAQPPTRHPVLAPPRIAERLQLGASRVEFLETSNDQQQVEHGLRDDAGNGRRTKVVRRDDELAERGGDALAFAPRGRFPLWIVGNQCDRNGLGLRRAHCDAQPSARELDRRATQRNATQLAHFELSLGL